MQRQQFDLPQQILSLGGHAKIVLVGMAQRQTLHPTMGDTANHCHNCISFAALVGNVLLCSIADRTAECPPGQSCNNTAAAVSQMVTQERFVGNSGRGGSLAQGVRTSGWVGNKQQPRVRLRWMLDVLVHQVVPKDRETAGYNPYFRNPPLRVVSYSDTPCLNFLERYGRRHAPDRAGAVQLLLAGDLEGRALPTAADVVLGDFAAEGRLELLDTSHDSRPR